MLTPKQLQSLPKSLTDIYSELADFVLEDIARRIAKGGKITDTAEYQLYRTRALGLSTKEIAAKIAEINGVSEDTVNELIRSAAEKSDEFDRRMLGDDNDAAVPISDNEQLQKIMAAEIKQTNGACENFVRTLGFAELNADGQVVYSSLGDFMVKQMDAAHMKVVNGVTDYNTAIRQACNALAASGVRTVYYNSGRSDRIEVAVRRALMTSVSQVTQKVSEQNAEMFGADGWEISAHSGARPSHAVYQGRQYPNSQYETIVKPLIEDYNCRHSAYPIILGISEPTYTEEQLQQLDPPPFTYQGKNYTAYEAQQQMRKMERAMRKQKDRCIVANSADDKEAFTAASIKLRRQKDIYENFCEAAGAYTEYERTYVAGYNRHLAGKTGAVTRRNREFEKAQLHLTSENNGGIISKTNYAKVSDIFQIHGESTIPVSVQKSLELLEESEIGREALSQLSECGVKPILDYSIQRHSNRGMQNGRTIRLYMNNIKNEKVLAQTIIHEAAHLYYNIGQSQWAEAVCFAREKMFLTGKPLTYEERKYIVKLAKQAYPEFNWKRGGYGHDK